MKVILKSDVYNHSAALNRGMTINQNLTANKFSLQETHPYIVQLYYFFIPKGPCAT